MSKDLIYLVDARRAILKCAPEAAYCLERLKKVDAVEVVRCKDCAWCEKGKNYVPYCNHPTDGMGDVQLDDFCSYGAREE